MKAQVKDEKESQNIDGVNSLIMIAVGYMYMWITI